jgi:hypothetical protein
MFGALSFRYCHRGLYLAGMTMLSFCIGLLLAGCNTASHSYLIKKSTDFKADMGRALLQVELRDSNFFSVSVIQDPGARVAMSQSLSAAYQSVPPSPGASPGGMAAAYVFSTYFMKAKADSDMHTAASEKAAGLSELLLKDESKQRIKLLITEKIQSMESADIETTVADDACCDRKIVVTPQVRLSNDLRTLEVKLDCTVFHAASRSDKAIYKNSFVYHTKPQLEEKGISYWSDDNALKLFQAFDEAFEEIASMIDYEFMPGKPDKKNSTVSTIKFRNERGAFYERGTLLWKTKQRIVLRDLRGNLRSFHGELL